MQIPRSLPFLAALASTLASTALISYGAEPIPGLAKMNVEELYGSLCASCHGAEFQGGTGGDLTDGVWKYGGTDEDLRRVIAEGLPSMGMESYKVTLRQDQIRALVVFLREKESQAKGRTITYPKPDPKQVTQTELEQYRIEPVVMDDLRAPWGIALLPDGSKLVTEKQGTLRMVDAQNRLLPDPVKDTPPVVEHGQGGLMDVAVPPDYAKSGWVYLSFSDGTKDGKEVKALTAVVRGRIKDGRWVDQEWIFREDPKLGGGSGVHFGSRIVFQGPYVFFIIGERGGDMQVQDLKLPNGKIYRLFQDGKVPPDNPFVGQPGVFEGIWSYGHRNPQGMALDTRNGDIYATEHGPRGGDEFNWIKKGANYGWPVITHGMNYNGTAKTAITEKEGMEQPVIHWTPSIAACGLAFYDDDKFPKWKNQFFAGSLKATELHRLKVEDHQVVEQEIVVKGIGKIRDVKTGPDGAIYLVLNGPDRVVKLVPAN